MAWGVWVCARLLLPWPVQPELARVRDPLLPNYDQQAIELREGAAANAQRRVVLGGSHTLKAIGGEMGVGVALKAGRFVVRLALRERELRFPLGEAL